MTLAATTFVVLGTQRTGTTLVRTSLNSHIDILCCGEVLLGKHYAGSDGYWWFSRQGLGRRTKALLSPSRSVADYLDGLYSRAGYSAIGFKLMLSQCRARPYVWSLLVERGVKAILVKRRNLLKTLISRRSAMASGVYHISKTLAAPSAKESWAVRSIWLDTATLIKDLDAIRDEDLAWQARLSDRIEHIEVVYEEYARDMHAINRGILDFLGVRQIALTSDLKKVNPDELSSLVSNYDEVVSVLRDTRYARHLD